jgi:serine protease Do
VLPHAEFGNSDTLRVGDVVLAIGNPFGVGQSVSQGIISALDRTNVEQSQVASFIQTDAAINPGNSGGALIDTNGKVIGINSAIFTSSGSSSGVGFAIPSRAVVSVINSVLETGQVEHAWLGAAGQDLTMDLAQKLGLASPSGVLINQVEPNSPAARADIRVGDIIQSFDGQAVPDSKSLESDVATSPVNTRVKLLPKPSPSDTLQVSGDNPLSGYTVANIGPGLAQQFSLPMNAHGVMVTGGPQSSMVGLQVGDILLAVNRVEIHSLDDLKQALKGQGGTWELVFRRGSRVFRTFLQ